MTRVVSFVIFTLRSRESSIPVQTGLSPPLDTPMRWRGASSVRNNNQCSQGYVVPGTNLMPFRQISTALLEVSSDIIITGREPSEDLQDTISVEV